jgi:asparagine synthase (glutamine-hydrolysing)
MNTLGHALTTVLDRLPDTGEVAVAVSGGLDSWVLALLLRRMGRRVRGYTLVSNVAGYCEASQTAALAHSFGVALSAIPSTDFEAALPRFLRVTQTPIYNLHPVSKLLLAEALAGRGVDRVVTGDAADQVFRCESDCDLLPLTQACFAHARVALLTPFLAPEVRALCVVPDPDKLPLRELATTLGIPPIAKRPTMFPGGSILERTTRMLEVHPCAASPA